MVHEQEHRQVDESGEEARAAAAPSLALPRARGQSSSEMQRAGREREGGADGDRGGGRRGRNQFFFSFF